MTRMLDAGLLASCLPTKVREDGGVMQPLLSWFGCPGIRPERAGRGLPSVKGRPNRMAGL